MNLLPYLKISYTLMVFRLFQGLRMLLQRITKLQCVEFNAWSVGKVVLLFGLFLCFSSIVSFGKIPSGKLTNSNSFSTPYPIQAIAISPDEALILVAMQSEKADSLIRIYDRQTQKPISSILSKNQPVQQLVADHYKSRVATINEKKIQLWSLENLPPKPDEPLSEEYLIWESKQEVLPNTQVQFSRTSSALFWVENDQILQLDLTQKPHPIKPLWLEDYNDKIPNHFSFSPDGQWMSISFHEDKRIALINPIEQHSKPPLDYHHFPVTQSNFIQPNVVLSLDSAGNLIWGQANSRLKIHGTLLDNVPSSEIPIGFRAIYQDKFFAILTQDDSNAKIFTYLIDRDGKELNKISLSTSQSLAISPTGTYIVTGSNAQQVNIHKFTPHQQPEQYIRQLNEKGAFEIARHYRNHLETPPPDQLALSKKKSFTWQTLLNNLQAAMLAEDWSEARKWVEKILQQDPRNAEALAAKELLKENQELIVLQKGEQEIANKEYKQAVQTLLAIPRESKHRQASRDLIGLAEKRLHIETTLAKVEGEILLENWAKAKALLTPVIGQDPQNPKAQELLEKIENHNNTSFLFNVLTGTIGIGLIGALGFLMFKRRDQLLDWLSLKDDNSPSFKPPLHQRKPKTPTFEESPEKQHFLSTLKKLKEMLRLTKEADKQGLYTGRLIDFEAEIAVIRKKASQPEANFKSLTNQLLVILQTVRSLQFTSNSESQRHQRSHKSTHQKQKEDHTHQQKRTHQQNKSQSSSSPSNQPTQAPNYYNILGLSKDATSKEIKQAYLQKMKEYHPDLHQNTQFDWIKAEAEAQTKLIQEAYETLKDSQSRSHYDKKI